MDAQKIIVIQPGSLNLRIGRASDLNPITILHALARKRRQHGKIYRDPLLPPVQYEFMAEFEEKRLQVIQASLTQNFKERGSKRMRVATPPQQIATFNKRSVPEVIEDDETHAVGKNDDTFQQKDTYFDRDMLNIPNSHMDEYNIHFPLRRGEFNFHVGTGGTMSAILADMEAIWLYALRVRMGIALKSLPQYSAVLVIPDVYNRSHLREMVTLLLSRLRFRSCFLLQDHVAATFGAGLGYACVVDVGDQKVSVSCVEDGISHPDTRVRVGYGGSDISQVFQLLLRKCSFPYKDCNVNEDIRDAILIKELKERFCHLNLDLCGAQERSFDVKKAGKHLRYTLQVGDECIVAPLSLFYTELLNTTGRDKQVRNQLRCSQQSDAEDCFDAEYIRETGRRNGRDQMLEGAIPITGEGTEDDIVVDDVVERDTHLKSIDKEEMIYAPNGQVASLDHIIMRSIERCASDELKRKMYSCILLVGGSVKLTGLTKVLEQKIRHQLAILPSYRLISQPMFEVNAYIKEMDAAMIAWKGAAIMSCLESAPELWIYAVEWEKCGLRVLREKAPFIW